ncbi:glutaredoxin-like domain-containing protein [Lipomyces arxii]|uniref:glutaredoxin-like domain-containing protein n=1 Tax=Lipomyces arxii TaxID=56418 RepID=UPI0034CD93DB
MRVNFARLAKFPSIILFGRPQCGLCEEAKEAVMKAKKSLPEIEYKTIDILQPDNKSWFDKYAYDVPVIHFQATENSPIKKIMHHIHEQDVINLVESSIESK